MQSTPPVSIIIPTLNEQKYLPILLLSLTKVASPLEVIVVDGNSEDRTRDIAQNFSSRFRADSSLRIVTPPARGVSVQRNAGGRAATHEILLFLDADVVFPSAALFERLIHTFIHKKYVVSGPYFTPSEGYLGAYFIYGQGALFQWIMMRFGRFYLTGSCILVRREVFLKIQGFDERMRVAEDADFSMRAAREGKHGLIRAWLPVSSRRFLKYGFWHVYFQWVRGTLLDLFGQRRLLEKLAGAYTFGEFKD